MKISSALSASLLRRDREALEIERLPMPVVATLLGGFQSLPDPVGRMGR